MTQFHSTSSPSKTDSNNVRELRPSHLPRLLFPRDTPGEWLHDAKLPVVLTEGERNMAALARVAHHGLKSTSERPRFLAIALTGNWRDTVGRIIDPDGARIDPLQPIPDLLEGGVRWQLSQQQKRV